MAVEKGTEEDFLLIRRALAGMENSVGNTEKFSAEDYKFHHAIVNAVHNKICLKAMESCKQEIYSCFYQMKLLKDAHQWGVEMHRKVYKAIISRDYKRAIVALKKADDYNYARSSDLFAEK